MKVAVSRAVRSQQCPLGEFPLYEDIISHSYYKICGKILFTIFTQTIMHLVSPSQPKKYICITKIWEVGVDKVHCGQ